MAKNLDGIKKLNSEEINKNRKIVLSYIGEKNLESTKEQKTPSRISYVFNKVDGIKISGVSNLKLKVKNILEKPVPAKYEQTDRQEKNKREELIQKEIAEKAKCEAEEQAKAEENSRRHEKLRLEESEREKKARLEERQRLEKERAKQIKIEREEFIRKEIAEKAKREAEARAKIKAEEARRWQEKLKLEEKIKEEARLVRMEAARKRKIKCQKAIKLFKKNLSNKLVEIFSVIKKNFIYGIFYLFTFLIIGYIIFCLLILRFKISDNVVGKIVRILPVPAAISSQGVINYYDFRGIRNNNYTNLSLAEKKDILAKWVILKNLSKKYNLPVNSSEETLTRVFVADEDFNQVGLSRIKKISQLLKNVDSIDPLGKYADEYSEVIYYNREDAAAKFGQTTFNLNSSQISDIIFSHNGYYIAQIVDEKNGQLGIKYLFIGANTLDQYVNEKLVKIKIFILAN